MTKHKIHPLAEIFPLIEGKDFDDLCADIKAHGLYNPIVELDGAILDGRNRFRACEEVGIAPRFLQFSALRVKCTPAEWVWSQNAARRHLTSDKRAALVMTFSDAVEAMKAEAKKRQKAGGGDKKSKTAREKSVMANPPEPIKDATTTRTKLAEMAGVTVHKIRQAEKLSPQQLTEVAAGKVTLAKAAKAASPPPKPKPKRVPPPSAIPPETECVMEIQGLIHGVFFDLTRAQQADLIDGVCQIVEQYRNKMTTEGVA